MNSMFFSPSDWQSIIFRLTVALLVGCAIGINRQQNGRPAGIKTFALVSLGAALFVMIPLQAEADSNFASTNALSRTIQGVTAGVGFLGGGIILQQSQDKSGKTAIKGVTSKSNYLADSWTGSSRRLWFVADEFSWNFDGTIGSQWG